MGLPEMLWLHRELVEEVRLHNLAVMGRRRQGGDWSAPENQYRNAIAEVEALAMSEAA